MLKSKIIGTGAHIPSRKISNEYFLNHTFFGPDQIAIEQSAETIIRKFKAITGIENRWYAPEGMTASEMGTLAAEEAIANAQVERESIDLIIVAHNYGDMKYPGAPRDMVPSLAARIKHNLKIKNVNCIPYDIIFGCPGWLQGLIQADMAIKSGAAKTCLVIGTETLSRVLDSTDRDSMIFSDGAGACIIQSNVSDDSGIINKIIRSDTDIELEYIYSFGTNQGDETEPRYIKMKGRKVYEYALKYVPQSMKECLDHSGESIDDLKMIFLHQANEKMDEAIVKRFYELYGRKELPENIMPMNISEMGNNSVATIPTLLHQVLNGEISSYKLAPGDLVMFASVGAGMNINAITYRW
ncbi:3-oxoacyl-ACP synthase III family protein [Sphingobacterium faecium]|uniref:3-oxoacyl-ACP synthase III family protein n=2 Tax=Sphingobacterium TaxID=28453 RepID=UPI002469A201|nr:ketoacyl-ACP synthase III [Sphingobacterium faecium]MDH5826711.1 ketoacyl-ACP synthase III [Sphingobacterium faecium]